MIEKTARAFKRNTSFSLLLISFVLLVVCGVLQVADRVKSVGPFMELFLTCGGLYFGRSFIKSRVDSKEEKVDENEEK